MRNAAKFYWLCQTVGWGAYSCLGLTTAVMEHGWRPSIVGGYILFFVYSIALTHLFRLVIHTRNWTSLSLPPTLYRLVLGSILIAAIQSALVVAVYTAIEGSLGIWSDLSSIEFMFMGLSVIDTIWAVLYLSITTMRNSRIAQRQQLQMKLALSDAELRALEAQINPHFLFNCLNSIRGMIVEDPAQAQDMVTRLANILRYSLRKDRDHTVALETEIEAVSDYLALESIRFDDRLSVDMKLTEDARRVQIPVMLLQTLVENAIKHGVEHVPGGGVLSIRAALEGDRLRMEVENPGGLKHSPPSSTKIGLANARDRLRILYGERASLDLLASKEGRVRATILIPITQ